MLEESSKQCLFSYFSAVKKSADASRQELTLTHILKECLISKDLQTITKKSRHTVLINVYSNCTAETFKAIL